VSNGVVGSPLERVADHIVWQLLPGGLHCSCCCMCVPITSGDCTAGTRAPMPYPASSGMYVSGQGCG
jgi:hypothetical protein